jgi:hypothetical protein
MRFYPFIPAECCTKTRDEPKRYVAVDSWRFSTKRGIQLSDTGSLRQEAAEVWMRFGESRGSEAFGGPHLSPSLAQQASAPGAGGLCQ